MELYSKLLTPPPSPVSWWADKPIVSLSSFLPLLNTGGTFVLFQSLGILPSCHDFSKPIKNGFQWHWPTVSLLAVDSLDWCWWRPWALSLLQNGDGLLLILSCLHCPTYKRILNYTLISTVLILKYQRGKICSMKTTEEFDITWI